MSNPLYYSYEKCEDTHICTNLTSTSHIAPDMLAINSGSLVHSFGGILLVQGKAWEKAEKKFLSDLGCVAKSG